MPKPIVAPRNTTKLSPLEEVLFQSWAKANGVQNHDHPDNMFDHRGLFKQHNGLVMPHGMVNQMAAAHNAANQPQDAGQVPDPYMAQAEVHKANLDAQAKVRDHQAKMQLEREKMAHKTQLEQMKLQHKSSEAEKDREAKNRLAVADRLHSLQDASTAREHSIQDAAANRESAIHDKILNEHFTRTRPQPSPTSSLKDQLMQRAMR